MSSSGLPMGVGKTALDEHPHNVAEDESTDDGAQHGDPGQTPTVQSPRDQWPDDHDRKAQYG